MTRHAAARWLLAGTLAAGVTPRLTAVDPDPAKLAPTPEQSTLARELVTRLGDPVFRVRDDATRELRKLGRAALPVLNDTLSTTPDPEVRVRCETLLPAIQSADLKARLAAFAADADGKYAHQLPGWDRFRRVTGNTADARKLFADVCQDKDNVELLHALGRPKEELEKLVLARRTMLYNNSIRYSAAGTRTPAKPADVAALLLGESAVTVTNRNFAYAINSLLSQQPIREAMTAAGGEPLRKLLAGWMDSRTHPADLYQAINLAGQFGLKAVPVGRYAEKLLADPTAPVSYRLLALTTIARVDGADALPTLATALDDKTTYSVNWFVNGQQTTQEWQVRDVALIMSVLATKQKPEDYGVQVRNQPAPTASDTVRFSYINYTFPDDKARDAAFARWKEYRAKAGK